MKKYKPLEEMTKKEYESFMAMVIKPLKDELRRRKIRKRGNS